MIPCSSRTLSALLLLLCVLLRADFALAGRRQKHLPDRMIQQVQQKETDLNAKKAKISSNLSEKLLSLENPFGKIDGNPKEFTKSTDLPKFHKLKIDPWQIW